MKRNVSLKRQDLAGLESTGSSKELLEIEEFKPKSKSLSPLSFQLGLVFDFGLGLLLDNKQTYPVPSVQIGRAHV